MHTTNTKVWVRALTVTTIVVAGAMLSGCSLLGQLDDLTGGGGTTGDDDVFSIKVGECFNDETAEGETVAEVEKVSCNEPHMWEAYESIIVDDGDGTYPGESVITEQAQTDCKAAFEAYVGLDYDNSTLDLSYYYPTQETWTQINDREILCLLIDPAVDRTEGSLQGAAR